MSTFIIENTIDEYVQQLKAKPMHELRSIMIIQSYNEKRWKLQSEFRKKLNNLLQYGNEICFLWKDENTEEAKDVVKNIETISFCVNFCINNFAEDFRLDNKIKIIQDFYKNSMMKDRLLLIQKQCLNLFQNVMQIREILISKAEEVKSRQNNEKLLTNLKNKLVPDPTNAKDIINIQNLLNQLYGDMSKAPQDQINLIDKYLALSNFIISVNQIYKFDFIGENEKIEKEERISIIDKEQRRVAALKNPYSAQTKEINDLKVSITKLKEELDSKEQLHLIKCQEYEDQIHEIHLQLIPLMNQK